MLHKETNIHPLTISLFSPGELYVLSHMSPKEKRAILQSQECSTQQQLQAADPEIPKEIQCPPSKTGEPNWAEVHHDAVKEAARKYKEEPI